MRHHLSFSFLDPHEIKRMEDQAKNAKLLPPTNGWQHLKTSEEKVLAYTFSPEFLEHPQLDWWSANYDVSYLVATGARLGCLVCKAAAYHRLSFFAMHEDEDDETDRDASQWFHSNKIYSARTRLEDIHILSLQQTSSMWRSGSDSCVFIVLAK